jgi:hypothetical protein
MSQVVRRQPARGLARRLTVTLAVVALTACAGEERGPNGELVLRGTVRRVETADGGICWRLEAGRGKQYELQPAQVSPTLLVDGARAVVLAKPRSGGSFCKVGDIVDVVRIDSLVAPTSTAAR